VKQGVGAALEKRNEKSPVMRQDLANQRAFGPNKATWGG
jgi:hypothetical protein